MACSRCEERRKALAVGASSIARGNIRAAVNSGAFVARTLVQDARSGALRTAAANQLAQMRAPIKRR